MEKNTRRILTAMEVAQLLRMSKWSIYNKVRSREIPAHQQKPHGRLFFFEDEVQAFVEGCRIRPMDEINQIANNI